MKLLPSSTLLYYLLLSSADDTLLGEEGFLGLSNFNWFDEKASLPEGGGDEVDGGSRTDKKPPIDHPPLLPPPSITSSRHLRMTPVSGRRAFLVCLILVGSHEKPPSPREVATKSTVGVEQTKSLPLSTLLYYLLPSSADDTSIGEEGFLGLSNFGWFARKASLPD